MDPRADRTSAITAVYKGTPKGGDPAMLRSYDSRREPAPEFDCKIWEAGRATCAIGLAFKPIQIGQSVFHDDGAGNFNPSIMALNEAVVNEWPGREVGVFVSVGTGKRPKGSDANSAMWYEGFLGEFADARRKLIAKIEGCERIHEQMKKEHLVKRGVNIENYYRFNVEVGVGEFGMNEWHRLADISTNTRKYMGRDDEQRMVQGASAKLAKIHFAKARFDRVVSGNGNPVLTKTSAADIQMPFAVELPGSEVPLFPPRTPPPRQSYESGTDNLAVPSPNNSSPRSSAERLAVSGRSSNQHSPLRQPAASASAPDYSPLDQPDRLVVNAPTPFQYRYASGADKIAIVAQDDQPKWAQAAQAPMGPPPLPPKTPLPENAMGGRRGYGHGGGLPYPLDDEAPPAVNMAKKPNYSGR